MKINAIKKMNSKYKIQFDNNQTIITYDNVILENNLLYDKKITSEILNKIKEDTNYYENYNKILKKISRKLKSEWEVRKELENNQVKQYDIEKIINKLKNLNLLNDREFAKAYTNDRMSLSMDGPYKIKQFLEINKIDDIFIQEALENFNEEIIIKRINKIINKKIEANTKDTDYIFKQKMNLYLLNLGYDKQDVINCLNNVKIDNNNLEKEMIKIYDKLKIKYSGYELNNKLKQKLFSKGFTADQINDFINKNSSLI